MDHHRAMKLIAAGLLLLSSKTVMASPVGQTGCVTDGGYAPQGTACAKTWTFNGITFTGCTDFSTAVPFEGLVDAPNPPIDGSSTDFWCSTVTSYSAINLSTEKKWGYCNCQPGGTSWPTTMTPTTHQPTTSPTPESVCLKSNLNQAACQALPGCEYYSQPKAVYTPSTPPSKRQSIGCNLQGACNIFVTEAYCNEYPSTCLWSLNSCVQKTNSPSLAPTSSGPAVCTNAQTSLACGVLVGCKWWDVSVCSGSKSSSCTSYEYGCQSELYCDFNKGTLIKQQCEANSAYCAYDSVENVCFLPAPSRHPVTVSPTTHNPNRSPTIPTQVPTTLFPSKLPTTRPTPRPSVAPSSAFKSPAPTTMPTRYPTKLPTKKPSRRPSKFPTGLPIQTPTGIPTAKPTHRPTAAPTVIPTKLPTKVPTKPSECTKLATQTACQTETPLGTCVWTEVKACVGSKCSTLNYGCQSYAFCGFNLNPLPSTQCAQSSEYCSWDATTNSCQPKCPNPALLTKRTLCSSFSFGQTSSIDGTRAAEMYLSNSYSDDVGSSISGMPGDFNGDGIPDWVVGAPKLASGSVFIRFGPINGNATFNLKSINGTNGVVLYGVNIGDLTGVSVSFLGDVNGDGIDDLLIGASQASSNGLVQNGLAYLVYGQKSWPSSFALSSLNGKNGIKIPGPTSNTHFGSAVASVLDVNRDGLNDFAIGAYDEGPIGRPKAGISYVIFGSKTLPAVFQVSTLNGQNGFQIYGVNPYEFSGTSLGPGGDLNSDRYNDIVIGAPWTDDPTTGETGVGTVYVVFGGPKGFYPSNGIVDLLTDLAADETTIPASTFGFRIRGISYHWGQLGAAVSPQSGDINGDGIDDIVIAAPFGSPNNVENAGESYIIFGRTNFMSTIDLSIPMTGTQGYRLVGQHPGDNAGTSIAILGDVNADGWDDIGIGAPSYSVNGNRVAGVVYVVFGQCSEQVPTSDYIALSSLTASTGITIYGYQKQATLGATVAGASDLNGDGYDDIIFTAPLTTISSTTNSTGIAYVLFGC